MVFIIWGLFIFLGLFAIGLLVVMLSELWVFARTRVPFVPSPHRDIAELVKKLPITKDDYVFDLGSGNGKVLFEIERLSGARVKGFQLTGWTQWYAQLKKLFRGSKAELVSGNFFKHSWSEATVVYAYLYPYLMRDIGTKALADCKPGTKVVTRDFWVPTLELHEKWDLGDGHEMFIYIV